MGFAARPALAVQTPTFVRAILASEWTTPSPDPMGITYDSEQNRLIVVDSEVEECAPREDCTKIETGGTNPPPYWNGVNVFEVTLNGSVERTVNISTFNADRTANANGFTDEPADIAYNPAGNGTYYIADDQDSKIYVVPLGANKALDATDARTSFTIRDVTSDSEGIGFGMVDGTPTLFIAAGEGPISNNEPNDPARLHEIIRLQPGPNGVFDGPARPDGLDPSVQWRSTGDDTFAHFDTCKMNTVPVNNNDPATHCTNPIGQADPEDVAYDEATGTLYFTSRDTPLTGGHTIVTETTIDGDIVDTYDLGDIKKMLSSNGARPSGIVIAPASGNSSERSVYISDRGVDNNNDTLPNDGRIFEFQLGGVVDRGPLLQNPGTRTDVENGAIEPLVIAASDEEEDYPVTCVATGLPTGLSAAATQDGRGCVVTGTIPLGAGGQYTVRVTATDVNNLTGFPAQFTWTITDTTPPAVPSVLDVMRDTTGTIRLDWPDSPESDIAGYNVYRSASVDGPWDQPLNGTPLAESEYIDPSPPLGPLFYRVEAVDKSSNRSGPIDPVQGGGSTNVTYVGRSSARGSGSTMSIAKPAGVQAGDVLLASFSMRGGDTVITPAGWTLVSQVTKTSSLLHQGVFAHTVGASDPASYGFRFLGRTSAIGMIVAYRGALATPQLTAARANPAGTAITAPGVRPRLNNSVQIGFFATAAETTIGTPTGMFEKGEQALTSGWVRLTMSFADVVVNAVPYGARVAAAGVAAENVGQVIVLTAKP